ncbi:VENN motif pre-toxin domain-containing protein, partial [Gilliamella sp. B14384H2]|uniref:VENN motif pre-toxin domain-containing protein n=1 Tax=unclassified Gilliamella TaxID=2685620 RepID=UPI0018DCBA77
GVDSAVSIITGIITGDIAGGLAGASAPWLAEQIKLHTGDNEAARLIAHSILGAVVAELQGNSGLAGGAGAVAGEVVADIIRKQLYGKEVKDLTEEEKETISALSQLATGLAVAAGGGNISDASTAISSSKNAVENNFLTDKRPQEYAQRLKACDYDPKCEQSIRREMAVESAANISKLKSCWEAGDQVCVAEMRYKISLIDTYYRELYIQDSLVGNAYKNSALWYSDIIDNCSNCGWLEAHLAKVAADGITAAIYSSLGSRVLPRQNDKNIPKTTDIVAQGETKVVGSNAIPANKTVKPTSGASATNKVKDNVEANVDASVKARESSNFREHVNKEREVNASRQTKNKSSTPIINPATNKPVTDHIIVSSGKAPKTSTPNSIYEVSRADGSRSITYYDEKGNWFSREDYGQLTPHGQMGIGSDGRVVPHEHKQTYYNYNGNIYKGKRFYRRIDKDGKPIGDWILDK